MFTCGAIRYLGFRRLLLPACCLLASGLTALLGEVALGRISADSLRQNVTWLAADQREGRMTPSPGLEASADYLGAQFREAGLTPGSGGTFFQIAPFTQITPQLDDFRMTLESGQRPLAVNADSVTVRLLNAIDYRNEPVVRLGEGPLPSIEGRVVLGGRAYAGEAALYSLESRKPALILLTSGGFRPKEKPPMLMDADPSSPPIIRIYGREAAALAAAGGEVRLTLHVAAPLRHNVALRNVAGMLRGSDPSLRDQFVIVSAHYDHLGAKPPGQGNRIFHGANDDASGAASLIEIAKGLAAEPHPRRSVLFLALFGEEEGLLGSAYYIRHPLIPVSRTIADINLEQLGRTDSSIGPELATFAFTGPSYSNLPQMMSGAAKAEGVATYRKDDADDYFNRSDNYSFALAGIVAHTIAVAFEFADYHAVSDEADKLDYENLARVDRGVAAGVAAVANEAAPPRWSDKPDTRIYRDAVKF